MHNACERRFLEFPTAIFYYQPFDPTVANSPLIRFYESQGGVLGRPCLHHLETREQIEQDWWLHMMMENPGPVLDVWIRFYAAWKRGEFAGRIEGTKMEAFLKFKENKLQFLFTLQNQKQPGYDTTQFLYTTRRWSDTCKTKDVNFEFANS